MKLLGFLFFVVACGGSGYMPSALSPSLKPGFRRPTGLRILTYDQWYGYGYVRAGDLYDSPLYVVYDSNLACLVDAWTYGNLKDDPSLYVKCPGEWRFPR